MRAKRERRGAPLVALGLIIGSWAALRVAVWQEPAAIVGPRGAGAETPVVAEEQIGQMAAGGGGGWRSVEPEPGVTAVAQEPSLWQPRRVDMDPVSLPPIAPQIGPAAAPRVILAPVGKAAGHQLLWLSALSRLPLPTAVQALSPLAVADQRTVSLSPAKPAPRRWSGDGWLLWRRGSGAALASAAALPSYGASQVGVVIRYRLDPASVRHSSAYARATAALENRSDREVAFGLSLRPIASVPLLASGELRVADRGGIKARPAAFVVTELPPVELPLGLRAEAYAQGGYVGGKDSTAFIDGQLRLDRRVARIGPAELRAGVGAWGGAQERAARLDLGPGATLGIAGGPGAARLAIDWRFRLAGDAAPSSGPALTLSAGF